MRLGKPLRMDSTFLEVDSSGACVNDSDEVYLTDDGTFEGDLLSKRDIVSFFSTRTRSRRARGTSGPWA